MKIKSAFFCLFFAVMSMTCGVIQAEQGYLFLDTSELKFIYSLDQIYISHPRELDFMFLSGFGMKYMEWKQLFLDEIEADCYSGKCISEEDTDEISPIYIGRVALFGRCKKELAKQIPCDGDL